jgi:hypothetical protein
MRTVTTVAALIAMGLVAAACGSEGDGADAGADADADADTDADADSDSDTDADGGAALAGELEVLESSMLGTWSSRLVGAIGAGGFPMWQQELASEGACRLFEFVPAYCDDYCEGVCVAENVCEPWPTFANAGALTIAGAKTPISTEPDDYGFFGKNSYYWYGEAADLFDDGDPITATFAGGEVEGFSVATAGVAPLALVTVDDDEITLSNDEDTLFEWEAGAGDARIRVTLNANSSGGHGSPYEAIIECDAADTGSLVIPRALVAAFPETYRWEMCAGKDCPLSTATRYRRGAAEIAGGVVELRVGSSVSFYIVHDLP